VSYVVLIPLVIRERITGWCSSGFMPDHLLLVWSCQERAPCPHDNQQDDQREEQHRCAPPGPPGEPMPVTNPANGKGKASHSGQERGHVTQEGLDGHPDHRPDRSQGVDPDSDRDSERQQALRRTHEAEPERLFRQFAVRRRHGTRCYYAIPALAAKPEAMLAMRIMNCR